ncbi:MAG: hypothetical protein KKC43_01545 [Alphaproteobacteria bacterium]|nr:hypothetical protein [Alphaproteobacteria bacterium]
MSTETTSGSKVRWPQPGELWSLWDIMKDLNAERFLGTLLLISNLKVRMETVDHSTRESELIPSFREFLVGQFGELVAATDFIGAEFAHRAAGRYLATLEEDAPRTVDFVRAAIQDVESRLTDEISLMGFMVLDRAQYGLMKPVSTLVDWDIARIFPDAARELEEAAKCLALQRATASVFHSMRMLEVAIRKLADILGIENPVKPAERNWGNILTKIKEAMDTQYPISKRLAGSKGAALGEIYASLDAIKHPWRNGTMHVEGFYMDTEAYQLLNYSAFLMRKLGAYCEPDAVSEDPEDGTLGEHAS